MAPWIYAAIHAQRNLVSVPKFVHIMCIHTHFGVEDGTKYILLSTYAQYLASVSQSVSPPRPTEPTHRKAALTVMYPQKETI
jgi:hypothetical protein